MIKLCRCEREAYDSDVYKSCFKCFKDRRAEYDECLWCGKWHSPHFEACYDCRHVPGREEATVHVKRVIKARDGFKCRNCGTEDNLQVDHIMPCAKRGTADPWNLQALCAKCNHNKADAWTPEYAKRLEYQMEQYRGALWKYLTPEERERLADEIRDAFNVPPATEPQFRGRMTRPVQWDRCDLR